MPQRTAYRIQKLADVSERISQLHPGAEADATLWKFREFWQMQEKPLAAGIDVFEIFRGSSQVVVLP